MELEHIMRGMARNAQSIRVLLSDVPPEQARWKPAADKWSLLEVARHLADEEREDFRRRLELLLLQPGRKWPPIDPDGWAQERGYNNGSLPAALADFAQEREKSLAWLRGLEGTDWHRAKDHPRGELRAGDLLLSWHAHDLLHIRQLARLHFDYAAETNNPFSSDYAGIW